MKKNLGFPQHLGQGGSLVTIYAPTRALKYFRISYRVGAKRRQRTFRTLEAAQREAEALLGKLRVGEPSVANLSTLEVAMLHTAKEELVGLEVRLDRACSEYARAIKRLGDTSLEESVGFYLEHHPTGLRDITLGLAVAKK